MTEAEWVVCDDPGSMLACVYGLASGRKLRLFSVACCRGADSQSVYRNELEAAEHFADGLMTTTDCDEALADIHPMLATFLCADHLLEAAISEEDWAAACEGASQAGIAAKSDNRLLWTYTHPRYSACIRELFGNPFRPVALDRSWLTSTVLALAKQMYQSRDFSSIPILADALQDAGCDNEDILNHCRQPGEHVRGCWVIDLVLGKS